MRAWFAGEFERCLELCGIVRASDVDAVSQLALLRARANLRLGRPAVAHRIVSDVFVSHGTLDASLTAQMLLGAAEIRLGDVAAGLERLDAASAGAVDAHPTIRSEIALNRALGHYARRDLDQARAAIAEVSSEADIVFAQSLNYRGWVETASGDHQRAIEAFIASVQHLGRCRHQDRLLEANGLVALAFLAAERFDQSTWSFIEDREQQLDWSADGLALSRWWITMSAALVHEAAGETLRAFKVAREAEQLAPSAAYRAHALCRRAALSRNVGECFTPSDLLDQARALLEALPPNSLHGDEQTVPLVLAEELAYAGDVAGARRFFALYRSLAPMERVAAMSADPRAVAYERMVEGAIADAAGETSLARRAFADAFRSFRALGYTRRAVACALRLAEITGHDRLYRFVAENTAALGEEYWVRRAMSRRERFFTDPIAAKLTAAQREVLDLICQSYTNPEIARMRDRSLNTIKHTVTALLEAFGVRGRAELRIEAERRLMPDRR